MGSGSPWAESQAGANNHRGGKLTQSSVGGDDEARLQISKMRTTSDALIPHLPSTHPPPQGLMPYIVNRIRIYAYANYSCFETPPPPHTTCTARQTTVVMRNKHFTALMATPKPGLMTAAKPRWLHRLRTETTTKWMRGARLVMQRINLFCLDFEAAKMRENGSVCNNLELN